MTQKKLGMNASVAGSVEADDGNNDNAYSLNKLEGNRQLRSAPPVRARWYLIQCCC
jgi:hypothetical protein